MHFYRKFTDDEIKEFMAGRINGVKEPSDEDLEKMAKEIFSSPDDRDYAVFLSDTMAISERVKTKLEPENKISAELENVLKRYPVPSRAAPKLPNYEEIKFGQIYSTIPPPNWPWKSVDTRLVMTLSDISDSRFEENPDVKIAPISMKIEMATDEDLIIQDERILNGAQFMIRFSDAGNLFCDQLSQYYGDIPEHYYSDLKKVWKYSLGLADAPPENCGKPLTDSNDPRMEFLKEERHILSYMHDPISEFIARFEMEEKQDEKSGEVKIKVIPLTHLLKNELLETDNLPLAAAKDNVLLLSEGKRFTIYRSDKLKITLRIYEQGLGVFVQSAKKEKTLDFKIISSDDDRLLIKKTINMTDNAVIKLDPPAEFINKSLKIIIGSSFVKKEINFKLFHGFFNRTVVI